ncbi:unnamed protein product [Brassica oleracea]
MMCEKRTNGTRSFRTMRRNSRRTRDGDSIFEMDSLKSVWGIYEAARKENEEDDPPRNDKKCIDELMNKSRGLPLAIRLMATLLPVFLDTESTAHDSSANKTTSEENRTTPLLQT